MRVELAYGKLPGIPFAAIQNMARRLFVIPESEGDTVLVARFIDNRKKGGAETRRKRHCHHRHIRCDVRPFSCKHRSNRFIDRLATYRYRLDAADTGYGML